MMKKVRKTFLTAGAVILLSAVISGCADGGGSDEAGSSQWDNMRWDQDNWA